MAGGTAQGKGGFFFCCCCCCEGEGAGRGCSNERCSDFAPYLGTRSFDVDIAASGVSFTRHGSETVIPVPVARVTPNAGVTIAVTVFVHLSPAPVSPGSSG
ncbi:hypothetical protein ESCO_002767 [Escovopsis weberi]|uniref:Uncharacterized protein n=1 Tax=Escovopsis weberi TaxID=150374 RepID=A0A0M8MTM2_ESCWE|nr:hypothetical protein ESCO_002767 [Escovopsis weberi]